MEHQSENLSIKQNAIIESKYKLHLVAIMIFFTWKDHPTIHPSPSYRQHKFHFSGIIVAHSVQFEFCSDSVRQLVTQPEEAMELPIIIPLLVASTVLWTGVDSGLCAHKELDTDSKEIITSLDNKLTSFESILSQVDNNLKLLNEKSLVWDLFRHHVDSWNDRIKALDDKIDLIKRTQEESKIVETKLTSLEFTLNHILSKVVYLSDNRYDSKCCSVTPPVDSHQKIITLEKEIKREITTRLSNILRHVLNIENGNCRLNRMNVSSVVVGPKNTVQVVQPVDTLRVLYEKVENFTNQFNVKQFTAIGKKNSKLLDELIASIRKVDARAKDMQNEQKLSSNYCQSVAGKIMTFTSSSGALLEKIENIVSNMQSKLAAGEDEEDVNDSMSSTTTTYGEDSIEQQDGSVENGKVFRYIIMYRF